jgi:hypothetical protein
MIIRRRSLPRYKDPYFPSGSVDLHYATSVEASTQHPKHFKITTTDKRYSFAAGSEVSRDEWVKTLRKVVFRCQNEGESVKVFRSNAIQFSMLTDTFMLSRFLYLLKLSSTLTFHHPRSSPIRSVSAFTKEKTAASLSTSSSFLIFSDLERL